MIPAVPDYLKNTRFNDTPPGHRFSLYLSAWKEQDYTLDKNNKTKALKETLSIPRESSEQIKAIRQRQLALLTSCPDDARLIIDAESISPMTTGMGMEHPLENGFAFLNPYGLPYLPGSSIKGVLRCAAEELQQQENTWTQEVIDTLFGPESTDETDARRGALIFWDTIPEISSMGIEIMTPHYSEYYQGKESPHDCGQPTLIPFLVVPPKAKFRFIVTVNRKYLHNVTGWQQLLQQAFNHAFDWLGFGAKTAVGYGAMEIDPTILKAKEKTEEKRREVEQEHQRKISEKEEIARKQAKLDALPEHEKTRLELDAAISKLPDTLTKDNYSVFVGMINAYMGKADSWDKAQRMEAAGKVEALYEVYGWAMPGTKSAKKKKSKEKKHQSIERLRNE